MGASMTDTLHDRHEKSPSASSTAFGDFLPPSVDSLDHEKQQAVSVGAPSDDWNPTWDDAHSWLVVVGCFIFSAVTAGWGLVWGVFQPFYQNGVLAGVPTPLLSFLGSVAGLCLTAFGGVFGKLADRYGYRPFLLAGSVIWMAGILGSAFSTKLWHFFLTQGVLQGISCAMVFPIVVAVPAQWFLKRRALAIGIVVAGSSLGGAVGTLLIRIMLTRVGQRKALVIYSCIDAVALAIALLLVKERRQPGTRRAPILWFDKSFLGDPVFWSLGACFLVTVFGYLTPIFFLPTYTKEKVPGISDFNAAFTLTVLNLAAAVGRTIIGFIADRFGPVNSLFLVTLLSGLSQMLVWTFVSTYGGIMGFAVLYGFNCGCFISLTPAVAARIYGPSRLAGLSGMLFMFNMPGNGAGAPVAGALLKATGHSWRTVACIMGSLQVLGAIFLLYARFKRESKIIAVI
ncbi:major facilitator superfamily domain-containing protein [Cristinia sonorae]|uniref:Major facilitator superfamily domain-containing protein n=1 Tax=Cristinia sonorae TaxID=1940300 RepID=A0A8K0UJL9_9AGAR|nr:major facilitator superfamily domain-containing protein [Cristinia sonorae]